MRDIDNVHYIGANLDHLIRQLQAMTVSFLSACFLMLDSIAQCEMSVLRRSKHFADNLTQNELR